MKAAILHSADAVPVYGDFDEPAAAEGTQVVDLVAAGIHHLTRSVAAGRHYSAGGGFPVIPPAGMASWLPLNARLAETGRLGTVLVLGVTGMSGLLAVQNSRLLGADTLALTGDRDADARALAAALDGSTPGLVLDFVWGPVAETAFSSLQRKGFGEDDMAITYVQIGALAGAEAAVPSALLRSRKLTISGSGAGSVAARDIKAQIPDYIQLIADGSVQVPYRTFRLSGIGAAWTASAQAGPRTVVVPG